MGLEQINGMSYFDVTHAVFFAYDMINLVFFFE